MNAEAFFSRVVRREGCWGWKGNVSPNGYGRVHHRGKLRLAPRVSWEVFKGSTEGKCVLHKCDNRQCTNPDHLFLGTRADNVRDMLDKGRWHPNRGEKNGRSKLTESDVKSIREAYQTGKVFQYELAAKFGVSQPVISKIVRGEGWVPH